MNLEMFYEKQEYLEQFVRNNIGMSEEEFSSVSMVDKRIFAFKVELGEFANETAFFKYWKQSHVMDREKVIEELADCIHFLLAIGIYRKYRKFVTRIDWERHLRENENELYRKIMESPLDSSGKWVRAFGRLIAIGVKLGYTLEDIQLAYLLKNQKNIERQLNKY
jgi:dimeric dUTPase (all-alpha-NTP-PPase superfamily)